MPVFDIFVESSLGFSHSGEVSASGDGYVELSDTEVQQLIDLIREKGGVTDVEELGLKERYPDIYSKLDEAYYDIAWKAEYNHWVIEGFENGWYEVDYNEAISICEEMYGFTFVFDRDKFLEEYPDYDPEDVEGIDDIEEDDLSDLKEDAFFEWVDEYRGTLDSDDEASFLSHVFNIEVEMVDGVEYEVEIPQEIVRMAESGEGDGSKA